MPFLLPNQQHQSSDGIKLSDKKQILKVKRK